MSERNSEEWQDYIPDHELEYDDFWESPKTIYKRQRRQRMRDGFNFLWTYYRVPFIVHIAAIIGGLLVIMWTVVQLVT